jgi:small-conductance mechanosensitive channel
MAESTMVIHEWLESALGVGVAVQKRLLVSVLILGGLIAFRWFALKVIYRRMQDIKLQYRIRKVSAYVAVGVAILAIGQVWLEGFRQFGTYFGLLSAGLAIALKDLVASIAGWAYLLWRHPFEVGDRVEIGGHAGDVIDIRLFRFTLMEIGNWVHDDQSTGRVIHIPNSRIFSEVIANYSKGFEYIWNEIPVTVTFESNWEKAKGILQEIADRHGGGLSDLAGAGVRRAARKALIQYTTLTPRVWTRLSESGVVLTIRYLCAPRDRRSTAELIWEEILRAFHPAGDIDFAYPTMRRFINSDEGKPGTGGPKASAPDQPSEALRQ